MAGMAAQAAKERSRTCVADGLHPAHHWRHCCSCRQLPAGATAVIYDNQSYEGASLAHAYIVLVLCHHCLAGCRLQGCVSCLQVASLLSGSDLQTTQPQKQLILRNQGLLKFVEQDYKGASSGSVANTSYLLLLSPADWYSWV